MTIPIQGSTLFLGDSITVRLPAFVAVNGNKSMLAEGGKTADWLLKNIRDLEKTGGLDVKNVVMLIGTNDVGGGRTAAQVFGDIQAVWQIIKHHGARLIVMTVPPFKGYLGYASRYAAIEDKRKRLNALILLEPGVRPDVIIRLDELVEDPARPEHLAPKYDGGDHLHLRKDAHGALINAQVALSPSTVPVSPVSPAASSGNLGSFAVLGCIVLAGAGVLFLTRKHAATGLFHPSHRT